MSGTQLTPEQIEKLSQAISANFQQQGAQETFCQNWDTAKQVLNMLQPILAAVPGVGIFAGPAIGVVLAAGDAAKKAVCT